MNPPMKLDEAKCGFVKAFGHGSEKWKGRLIESFEDTVQEWLLEDVRSRYVNIEMFLSFQCCNSMYNFVV
jgi:hypothetical protein